MWAKKMTINSKDKGKRGERMWRDQLREAGFLKSYRGQQYEGSSDSPDVVCPELPQIHFEVKYTERLDLYGAVLQATDDAHPANKIPVVAHRKNNQDWLVVMRAGDWFNLIKDADYAKLIFCPDCKLPNVRARRKYYKGGFEYECLTDHCGRVTFVC